MDGLEVDATGELEVAAGGIASCAAHRSEVRAIRVYCDATERYLVGNVLAIGTEHEFQSFADVEGAHEAAIE